MTSQGWPSPVANTAHGIQVDGAAWGVISTVTAHHLHAVARPSLVQRWRNHDVVHVMRKGGKGVAPGQFGAAGSH
jgi:hypothetical protein